MKVSNALRQVAELREKLKRLKDDQEEDFIVKVPVEYKSLIDAIISEKGKGADLGFILFDDYEKQIEEISEQLIELRERLDRTAHKTDVNFNGVMSLARLRLLAEEQRAKIDRLIHLRGKHSRRGFFSDSDDIIKADSRQRKFPQINRRKLESMIDAEIKKKVEIESKLEEVNATTELD